MNRWYAVAHPGLERVVADELRDLGITGEVRPGGVRFDAPLGRGCALARVLRTPDRLLLEIAEGPANTIDALGGLVRRGAWKEVLHPQSRLEVAVTSTGSRVHFKDSAGRKVQWAIGEALKGPRLPEQGARPRLVQRVQVRIVDDRATVSLDAGDDLLHKRGWRTEASRAPLRENLAAALIRLARWDGAEPFLDPCCGSGTLPIEAALLAAGRSPHAAHPFACDEWKVKAEAPPRLPSRSPLIVGADHDAEAVRRAVDNAARARVHVAWRVIDFADIEAPAATGLVVTNPPWGLRIAPAAVGSVYARLGRMLRDRLPGWRAVFLAPAPELARKIDKDSVMLTTFSQGGVRVGVWETP